jgi:hypothetical protein
MQSMSYRILDVAAAVRKVVYLWSSGPYLAKSHSIVTG